MVWIYTADEPEQVETAMHLGQRVHTVNYEITPLKEDDPSGYRWRHRKVTLSPGIFTYDAIVSALIEADYPCDRMQAIVNNYLADPADSVAADEMQEMQECRKTAKRIAREALEYMNPTEGLQV